MLNPGEKVGSYELVQKLGVGGMAEVWLATQSGPAGFLKRVVLKRVLDARAEQRVVHDLLLHEARLVAGLIHDNLVQVVAIIEHGGAHFIVMEWIPGRSVEAMLARLRKRGLKLQDAVAVGIMLQVCEGLHYAHEARDDQGHPMQVVHRDITPGNIIVGESGQVKVIDFGVASSATADGTGDTLLRGTPWFMSPEQALLQEVDARADVYGVGATLFRMLYGRRPFHELALMDVVRALRRGERPELPEDAPVLDPGLADIVQRAMHPDADARIPSCAALRQELATWLQGSERPTPDRRRLAKVMSRLFPEGVRPPSGKFKAVPPAPALPPSAAGAAAVKAPPKPSVREIEVQATEPPPDVPSSGPNVYVHPFHRSTPLPARRLRPTPGVAPAPTSSAAEPPAPSVVSTTSAPPPARPARRRRHPAAQQAHPARRKQAPIERVPRAELTPAPRMDVRAPSGVGRALGKLVLITLAAIAGAAAGVSVELWWDGGELPGVEVVSASEYLSAQSSE